MSEHEALAIGSRAAPGLGQLTVLRVQRTAQGPVWLLGSLTAGSGAWLQIEDASGRMTERGRWGIR